MKRYRFQFALWICVAASLLGLWLVRPADRSVYAQTAATDTPTPGSPAPFITQTYSEAINVRTGPSTVYYPIIGQLAIDATAPALGVSPSHEWIKISYPSGPGGVGWIYAANVTLSPGFLPVVEPPPTATPLATATIDPTLAAAFNIQPTETRLPTFTPPPPLVVPTFSDSTVSSAGFPMGVTIIAVAMIGALVLVVSFFGRH